MKHGNRSASAREQRILHRSNTGEWASGTLKDTYLAGPYRGGNNWQKIGGPAMAVGSTILEGPDQVWADLIGQKVERPAGIAGRTRRDVKNLLKDTVTLHPLRAVSDAWRLAFSDLPLDGGDILFGFHAQGTRGQVRHALHAGAQQSPSSSALAA